MWRCKPCGKENSDDTRTCRRCGTRHRGDRLSGSRAVAGEIKIATKPPTKPPQARRRSGATTPGVVVGAVDLRGRLVEVRPDGTDHTVHWLESNQVDLGSREGDIRFDDPQLAPRHCRLNLTLGGAMVTPLDTRNGVYLRLRHEVELTDGDHLLLGRQVLRFERVPEHEKHSRPAIEGGVVLFGTPTPPAWGRLRQMMASGVGRDVTHLSSPQVTLGREKADLVFTTDEFLSRRHAQVSFQGGRFTLADLGSSNGTYIRLRSPQVLVPGDMIRLGDELLRFELG